MNVRLCEATRLMLKRMKSFCSIHANDAMYMAGSKRCSRRDQSGVQPLCHGSASLGEILPQTSWPSLLSRTSLHKALIVDALYVSDMIHDKILVSLGIESHSCRCMSRTFLQLRTFHTNHSAWMLCVPRIFFLSKP